MPKGYYLVDSLAWESVSDPDKNLIDSCLKVYHTKTLHDTLRIKSIGTIVENSWDDDVWPKYNQWMYNTISAKLKNNLRNEKVISNLKNLQAGCLNNFGVYHTRRGNKELAIRCIKRALSIHVELGDKKSQVSCLNNLGVICSSSAQLQESIQYHHKSLKISESIKDYKSISTALNNLGATYEALRDNDKAFEFYKRGLEIRRESNDQKGMSRSLLNLGALYLRQDEFEKALEHLQEGLNISTKIGDDFGIARHSERIGEIYSKKGMFDLGINYFGVAIKLQDRIKDKEGLALTHLGVGKAYYEMGNFEEAERNAQIAIDIAKSSGMPLVFQNGYELLSDVAKKQNFFEEALTYFTLSIEIRDSLYSVKAQKTLMEQEAKYEYEKQKVIDSKENEKKVVMEREKKNRQQIVSGFIGFGLLIVLAFLLFVFQKLKQTKKQKLTIEEAHIELGEKNKEITDSINYAKRLQEAILPPMDLIKKELSQSFVLYKPKDIVAGDFYWFEKFGDLKLFAVADCTGHGVPGAMVSVVCNNALNRSVHEFGLFGPDKILDKTRELVIETFEKSNADVKDGMDIALCALKGSALHYSGANNPLWVYRKGINSIDQLEEYKANKQPIGKYGEPKPFISHTIELNSGDSFYLFTDGFADQFGGEKGKKFKYKPMKQLLLALQTEEFTPQENLLENAFNKWKGSYEQVDDVCIMGVKV